MRQLLTGFCTCVYIAALTAGPAAAELFVGTATCDITPDGPVAVSGQFSLRIAKTVETPITANVVALESRRGGVAADAAIVDVAIMVSCDLLYIPREILAAVRERVNERLPELDVTKIFLAGTHTHTAPVLLSDKYAIPKQGVVQVAEYRRLLARRVGEAIVRAWEGRRPGSVSWGLGHAVVAYNRRAVYADGSARMYGPTDVPEFRSLEGYEDHDLGSLFFWNEAGELIGVAVNVSCPSQEVESRRAVNADFWHPVRQALHEQYGERLCVLGWTGAAGDQSPHVMYREAADERMRKLRGLSRTEEIARRIARGVEEAYEVVRNDRHAEVALVHKVQTLRLPMRLVTEAEYAEAKAACEEAEAQMQKDPKSADRLHRRKKWYEVTVERYQRQAVEANPVYEMELHVLRIGDAVVCTNPFELFTDFGIRIKARSKAVQTFVVQLAGPGTYVPTEKAVRGGHYSAIVHSSLVGPEGGQALVERTVELIDSLWEESQ